VDTIEASASAPVKAQTAAPRFHHVAIQTSDLDNSLGWYQDFFGGRVSWSLSTFSHLTLSRLPGIRRLVELVVGDIRFHIFERPRHGANSQSAPQFQHVCVSVDSQIQLTSWRDRWLDLFASGRYKYAVSDGPSEIVVDASGVHSFYALDVDGLEFEFTYASGGAQ
jgi:catechol 2,3-dioxygenase-like lactoylglutathione lyase family enzyme